MTDHRYNRDYYTQMSSIFPKYNHYPSPQPTTTDSLDKNQKHLTELDFTAQTSLKNKRRPDSTGNLWESKLWTYLKPSVPFNVYGHHRGYDSTPKQLDSWNQKINCRHERIPFTPRKPFFNTTI